MHDKPRPSSGAAPGRPLALGWGAGLRRSGGKVQDLHRDRVAVHGRSGQLAVKIGDQADNREVLYSLRLLLDGLVGGVC